MISTNPPQGNNVKANTLVTLFVSSGPQAVSVPTWSASRSAPLDHADQRRAERETGGGHDLDRAKRPGDEGSTRGGPASVAPGSTVTIYVSGGAVTVQSVISDTAATADAILQGQGSTSCPRRGRRAAGATPGDVFQQTPAANTSVAQGSTVTIYIAVPVGQPDRQARPRAPRPPPARHPRRRPAAATGTEAVAAPGTGPGPRFTDGRGGRCQTGRPPRSGQDLPDADRMSRCTALPSHRHVDQRQRR